MRIDLHIHTMYSFDCTVKPEEMVIASMKRGLQGIAITDHGSIKGVERAKKAARRFSDSQFLVIPGMEIVTPIGDVIALFIQEPPRAKTLEKLWDEAKKTGAILMLPHPARGHSELNRLASVMDCIETLNSRSSIHQNLEALQLAKRFGASTTGGSDAHSLEAIGKCVTVFENNIKDEAGLIQELKGNKFHAAYFRL